MITFATLGDNSLRKYPMHGMHGKGMREGLIKGKSYAAAPGKVKTKGLRAKAQARSFHDGRSHKKGY
jgi:hypothetical protein